MVSQGPYRTGTHADGGTPETAHPRLHKVAHRRRGAAHMGGLPFVELEL